MYKDVGRAGKRILAVVLSLCMILGLTDFSVLTVRAEGEAVEITAADIYTSEIRFDYNGEAQKPTISIKKNGVTLQENTDYELEWGNINIKDASGEAIEVPIKGLNNTNYTWPKDLCAKYWILPRELENNRNSITIEVEPQKFQDHLPLGAAGVVPKDTDVIVTDKGIFASQGGKKLNGEPESEGMSYDGLDYTYSCENNTTTGTATIKFIGHNNYKGTISSTFIIRNNAFGTDAFIDDIDPQELGYIAAEFYEPALSIYTDKSNKTGTALPSDNYEVTYNEAVYPGTNIIKPGTYTAKITGQGSYAGSVVEKSYKVVKKINVYSNDITVKYNGEDGIPDQPYTGSQIKLDGLEVYDKGVKLTENVDYSLYYDTNMNAGKGGVLVSGKSGSCYKGDIWFDFNITAGDLSAADDVEISVADCVYTGSPQKPDVTVTFNGIEMKKGSDYEVTSYADNTNAGQASVTITGRSRESGGTGNLKNSRTVSFQIKPKSLSTSAGGLEAGITVSGPAGYDYDGDKKIPVVSVTYTLNGGVSIPLTSGKDYTITPASSTAAGTVTVTIEGKGNYTGKITRDFTINAADITDLYNEGSVTVSGITPGDEYTYVGKAIQPNVTVKHGGKNLTSADYEVTYGGDNINAGTTAKVVITGKNNYTGTIEIPFKIVAMDIGDTSVKYTPQKADATYIYTFEEIKPAVKLEYQPSTVRYLLAESTDYTIEYTDNVDRGTATITIKGMGNYKGTRTENFTIDPLNLSDSGFQITIPEPYYPCVVSGTGDIAPVDPTDIKYGTVPALVYSKDGKKHTVPSNTYTWELSQNTAPGKGILTASAIEGGTSNFTGTTTGEFNIKGDLNDADIKINNPQKVYTGKPITLGEEDITVTYNGKELTLGTDYVLPDYSDNTEVSTADAKACVTVEAEEKGDYYTSTSGIQGFFEIVKKNLNDRSIGNTEDTIKLHVDDIPDQEYTGSPIVPNLTVEYNGTKLVKDTDYKIIKNSKEHSNNIDAGDAYITIEGMGSHFTGTREIPFTITKRDISKGTITIAGLGDERIYNGQEITLGDTLNVTFEGTCTDGAQLTLNNNQLEYTVSYDDNNEVGDATVVITGDGDNFTGRVEKTFRIKGDLTVHDANTRIEVKADKTYNGQAQTLDEDDITVTYFDQELSYGIDYEIEYTNDHTNASGNVAFTVKAKGNYFKGDKAGGQDTESGTDVFSIDPKDISSEDDPQVTVKGINKDGYTYTGAEQHPEKKADFAVIYTSEAGQEITLVKGEKEGEGDYTVTVENALNVGDPEDKTISDEEKPRLVITPKEGGNYKGTRYVYFKINPQSVDVDETIAKYQVTADNPGGIPVDENLKIPFEGSNILLENLVVSCNGNPLTAPKVNEEGIIVEENDYTLSYKGNDGVGKAYLVIEGHGNYCDTKEIPFWITGNLSDDEAKNPHYDQIKVNPIEPQPYTMGDGAQPKVEITYYGKPLTESEDDGKTGDYILTYENNKNVAKKDSENPPTVIIEGINGFEGIWKEPFEIVVRNLSTNPENMTVEGLDEDGYAYTGSEICPSPLKLYNNGWEVDDDQYTITYGNNVNGADKESENPPYVRISGKYDAATGTGGNYTGYMDVPFTIIGIPIDETNRDITVEKAEDQIYTGKAIEPKVVVKHKTADGTTVTLEEGMDYKLTYVNNTNVNTGSGNTELPAIKIEGINNFSGERKVTFKILPRNMETYKKEFTVTTSSRTYTGSAVIPTVQVKHGDKVLVKGTDYTVSPGSNSTEVGTGATVIINGIGNYTGKLTGTFEIKPKSIADEAVKVTGVTDKVFNSKKQTQTPVITWGDITLKASDYSLTYSGNDNVGTATMTVTGKGNYTGTKKVTFKIAPYTLKKGDSTVIVSDIPDQVYTGKGLTPRPVITYRDTTQEISYQLVYNKDYKLTYVNNTNVNTGSGNTELPTIKIEGINNFRGGLSVTFKILPRNMETYKKEFTVTTSSRTYTGSPVIPTVQVKHGDKVLVKGTDYTVSPGSNSTKVGTRATVIINGKGNYTGKLTGTFEIKPKSIADEAVKMTGVTDKVFNSKKQTQTPVITWGDITLKASDYSLSYSDNVNAGTATMTVTGKGNYTGTKTVTFKITPYTLKKGDSNVIVSDIPDQVYTGKGLTPKPVITYRDAAQGITNRLVYNKDYTLTYKGNNVIGKDAATVTIVGKGNFAGSLQKKFTVVGNIALAAVKKIPTQNYTGKALKPEPVVMQAGKTLVKDRDYKLTYKRNTEAGKATVTIKGTGDTYGGTKTVTFNIVRDISKGLKVVGLSDSYTYTGKSITPSLGKVSIADKTLVENTDYKVTFSNNKNEGTATMKISGIGYYKGSKSYNFKITRRNIAQCRVSAVSNKVYNGKSKKPKVTIKYGSATLKEGKDYKLVYLNNKLPGRASIIISGAGNYNGNKLIGFNIELNDAKGLKASALSTSRIKLSWSRNSGVTGYQIVDSNNRIVAKIVGSSLTSYVISGLKAGSTHYYKVRSYLINGGRTYYSDFSSLVKAVSKPSAPKISVSAPKAKQAFVSWKKVSGANGYEIYRKTKNGGYRKVTTTTRTSYTNTKLTSGNTYYFKVRAYKNVNGKKIYSGYSNLEYVIIK